MADEKPVRSVAQPKPGLCCPRCQEAQVAQLPANGISPRPGYRCLSCGTRMRGMTGGYVLVVFLGLALLGVAAGLIKPFGDIRDQQIRGLVAAPMGPGSTFFIIPLYLGLVAFSIRELFRPRPRRT